MGCRHERMRFSESVRLLDAPTRRADVLLCTGRRRPDPRSSSAFDIRQRGVHFELRVPVRLRWMNFYCLVFEFVRRHEDIDVSLERELHSANFVLDEVEILLEHSDRYVGTPQSIEERNAV